MEAKRRRDAKEQADILYNAMKTVKWPLIKYFSDKKIRDKMEELEVQRLTRNWCIKVKSQFVYARILAVLRKQMYERKIQIALNKIGWLVVNKLRIMAKFRGSNF